MDQQKRLLLPLPLPLLPLLLVLLLLPLRKTYVPWLSCAYHCPVAACVAVVVYAAAGALDRVLQLQQQQLLLPPAARSVLQPLIVESSLFVAVVPQMTLK